MQINSNKSAYKLFVNWYKHFGQHLGIINKVKIHTTYDHWITLLGAYFKHLFSQMHYGKCSIIYHHVAENSPAFLMMCSAYKLNKQGDNIQPWCTPFPIWNQSFVPRPVLTIDSWPAYRFPKGQVRRSGIPISFRIFHSLFWSTQSKALT